MENINQNHHPGLLRDDSPHSHGHPDYMNGKIIVTSLIIIVILIIIIIAFHVYGRWFWRRRRTSMSWRGRHISHEKSPTGGLDKAIVDSLPTFTYTTRLHHDSGDVVSKEVGASVVECAVCLNEFQDDDACRLLPRCNHSFHTDCIDMWFLSNTTCPMCRTSAQVVDSDNAHLAESSAAFLLPCQDIQMTGLSSTACTMPRVDTGNRIQRSRSSSLLGREHEQGPGPHVRGILMRTCSSRVDASYNMVGEQMHNIDTMSGLMCNDRSERHGNGERAHSHLSHSGQAALLRRLPFPNWRRSVSDRFLNMRQFVQFPSTVRFGRNGNALSNTDHWQVGGRSLPHIIIDVPRPVGDNFLAPRFASSSPLRGISTDEQRCILPPPVQRQPSQMCS